MRCRWWAFVCLWLALISPALAQNQVETYKPDFFAAARPATAMDMINRLPGFSFDGGDGSRGFSGNSGNVLIDGKRPTSKTDSLYSVLARTLAADVDHIEVIHGGASGIDMQGRPVIANVIRKQTESHSIVAAAGETFFPNVKRGLPDGSLQYSSIAGPRSYDLSIRRDVNFNSDMGEADIIRIDATGKPARSEEARRSSGGNIGLNGDVKLPLAGGDFGANATLQQQEYENGTLYENPAAPQNFSSTSNNRNGEIGASYQRQIDIVVLNTEVLQRLGHSVSNQLLDDTGVQSRFSSLQDTGESIAHLTLRYPVTGKLTLEGGLEAAYNFLNGRSLYTQGGQLVAVPSSDVAVSERRGEVFAQASWQVAAKLLLEGGVRAEYSTISETGDVGQSRSFFYPKPRAVLTWTINPKSLLRLRAEHQLGQLNFGDFTSSASLTQNNVTAGNPDLKPDESWQYEAAYEYHFWERGAVTLGLLHQNISNILDDKPLADSSGNLFDVRGNIGNGRADQGSINVTLPTDRLGLAGGLLTTSATWRDSAVKDPLTGITRRFAFEDANSYQVRFSQDLTQWKSTWNISYNNGWKQIGYRLSEIDRFLGAPSVNLGWTYKPSAELSLSFQISNPLIASRARLSDYYTGPRNVSPVANREIETGYARPRFYLGVRKTFN